MKGYGHMGYGAPYSLSSSSLSPLAPPFTVDSSYPKPQSNQMEPNLHEPFLQDATQYAFVANPSHGNHNWNQKDSQALFVPHSISNSSSTASPISGLSAGTGAVFHGFVPSFGPQISRPYHPQYSPASVQDSSTSLSADKHGDLLPSSSYLPTAPVGAFWNGKSSEEHWKGKDVNLGTTQGYEQWKRKDMNLGVPPTYASLVNQGISSADGQPACEEPSNVWVRKSVESLAGDGYVGVPPRKLSSAIEESSRDVPFDMSRTSVSLQEVPYYRAPSPDFTMEPWSQVNPSITSYGGYFTGFDSYKADPPLVYHTPSNASVDHLYGTASNDCSSATPLNRTVSANMTPIERPRDTCDRKEAFASFSSSSIEVNTESNKGHGDKGINYDGFEENRCASSLLRSIRMLQDYPLTRADALKKAKSKGQVSDYDLPGTLATSKTGVSESFECSSDVLEQANPGVDSPCWKGALDSRYSLFGEAEAENPSNPAKIPEHCLPVNSDKPFDFTSLEVHRFDKRFGETDSSSFPMQSELTPQSLRPSNGDGCLGIGVNDSTHVGTDWAYHVSDHLSSRGGNVCVDTNLTEPLLGRSNNTDGCQISRENVQTTIASMHNLSELLVSYCSMDEDALKEEDHALLQQVVQNLHTSMLKAGGVRLVPEAQPLQSKLANCSGSTTNVHKATVTSKYTGVKDVESANAFKGKKIFTMFSMEEMASGGNSDSEQDEITEGVKEVLEKNFHDEDLPEEEQGMLYKNLWLEAEAALFAMKFKARVARMKIKMEKKNHNLGKGEAIDVEEIPSSKSEEKIQSPRIAVDLNKDIPVESGIKENEVQDVESSVLARFRILKSRINKEEISCNPSKENEEKAALVEEKVIHPGFEFAEERRSPWPFIRNEDSEDKVGIVNVDYYNVGPDPEPEPESFGFGGPFMVADRFSNGESGSPSSEWEHVLKEATWPVAA